MNNNFHHLSIADLVPNIDGAATSITFRVPNDLHDTFAWQAGQHLTLRFHLNGTEYRRSYTISNPPDAALRITVKRVAKGIVSNHIGDSLAVDDRIDVMRPSGGFYLDPNPTARRTHYFFASGSGITPAFAMINAVLTGEPHSVAHLIFGNSDADSILFRTDLDALLDAYPTRFTLRHVLSSPSMWNWLTPWRKGRVDAKTVKAAITETPPVAQDVQYWICGPGSMNMDVKAALMALDVPAARIHMESFGGAVMQDTSISGIPATATVTLDGTAYVVPVAQDQTLLEAMRAVDLSPPFSCQSGVCGACKSQLNKGSVHMRNRMALDEEEIAAGSILTCQSVATDAELAINIPE